jgi:DNA polymerase III delta prime subunit
MPLPTTKTKPLSDEPGFLILYGPPKVGKTSTVAQLADTLIISTEPGGTSFCECMSVEAFTYSAFEKACQDIIKEGRKYKRVCLDSVDAFERFCNVEANVRYKTSNIGMSFNGRNILTDLPKGGGYPMFWDTIRDGLDLLTKTAPQIILVGHLKEKLLTEDVSQENADGGDLDLTGKVKNIVCSRADAIGLLKRKGRPRKSNLMPLQTDLWINFRTTDATNCGCRIERLAGKEFIFATHEDRNAKWEEIFPSVKTTPTVTA